MPAPAPPDGLAGRGGASSWEALAAWWVAEVADDPAYRDEILPLLRDVLGPAPGERLLDLGCGEGQGMALVRRAGALPVGCDIAGPLLERARRHGPVVRGRLPDLNWAGDGAFDGAYAVLVLEHLQDVEPLFAAVHRVVAAGGGLTVILNHPVFTAPGSGPFVDQSDGETLWRWGRYFGTGVTTEPAGAGSVTFHHRPLDRLLTAAARGGWSLRRIVERPIGERAAERDALLAAQRDIPRLLAVRSRRDPAVP